MSFDLIARACFQLEESAEIFFCEREMLGVSLYVKYYNSGHITSANENMNLWTLDISKIM